MARVHPWVLATVAWSDETQFIRGTHDGLPLLTVGLAPKDKLATFRQLRAMDLRPGGADPVAVLYLRHRASRATVYASLYLIADAVPVRPMTPAKWTALAKANLARRICVDCGRDRLYIVPTSTRQCWKCFETNDIETTEAA